LSCASLMLPSKQISCKIQARKGARCAHEREEGMNQAWLHPFWRVSLYSKNALKLLAQADARIFLPGG